MAHELSSTWTGTREALRAAVRKTIHAAMRTLNNTRRKIAWMLCVVREARFAALVAGAIVAGFGASPAAANPSIQLSDIAMDSNAGGFAINGEVANDYAGRSVSGAGDVNGDGLADLIVGALRFQANGPASGRSYVIFGRSDGTSVSLSDIAAGMGGFAMDGEDNNDRSGISVSAAGDVNGDGMADLIVGASQAFAFAGGAYVVFGKADTTKVQLSDVTAGLGGFAIIAESNGDFAGCHVSAAGDVNGDGLDDVIVGTRYGNSGLGRSFVVFGKTDGASMELSAVTAGIGGFAFSGGGSIAFFSGANVSAAGDVNGDGLSDMIFGSHMANPNGRRSGRSYVVFGKGTGDNVQATDIMAGRFGFAMDGEDLGSNSGFSVSGAGDVNGDGLADLIVGAPQTNFVDGPKIGRGYIILGKNDTKGVLLSDISSAIGGSVVRGAERTYGIGESVSDAGDINGDGLADLIVGAPRIDANGPGSGRSYVIFGRVLTTQSELSDVTAGAGGFSIDGESSRDYSGMSVSKAGDVNGDGLADLIVGSRRGRSYVVFSPETPPRLAVYNAFSRAGDGPGGNPVVPTVVGDSRLTIDWPDDDFGRSNFGFGSSKERIVLYRSNSPVRNLEPITNVARVCWGVLTNRTGAGPAELTFKYLNHEIAEIALASEADLAIFAAEDFIGPWVRLPTTIDAARNTARVTSDLSVFRHFALAEAGTAPVAPVNAARNFELYE